MGIGLDFKMGKRKVRTTVRTIGIITIGLNHFPKPKYKTIKLTLIQIIPLIWCILHKMILRIIVTSIIIQMLIKGLK